jgi:hypothetical protein
MPERIVRIANGAGFLGDSLDAPRRLVESAQVDYLTIEHLAELTLSILARQREKNPAAGYAEDFLDILRDLCPALAAQPQLRIVTNAGGMNPLACAKAAVEMLDAAGLGDLPLGVVTGDDLLGRLDELRQAGCNFTNLDTGEPLAALVKPIVSANAYLGALPVAETLASGARVVITGRVADASLTVGPAVHEFGWKWDDWNRLAAASVAGHLIECGAQVTGGYSTRWENLRLEDIGYPIAELESSGNCIITKPAGSGGRVDRHSVALQLIYEIGDPRHYLTPDVDVDFTTVEVEEIGENRVIVKGATGRPATDTYKVSLAYRDGFMASAQLLVFGTDCVAKAQACAGMVFERLKRNGYELDRSHVECLGAGAGVPGLVATSGPLVEQSSTSEPLVATDLREVMLRISVHDARREAVERFAKEIAPLITSGPAGLAGYASGRAAVRPVFAYWPTLVPKALVTPRVEVRKAAEWAHA